VSSRYRCFHCERVIPAGRIHNCHPAHRKRWPAIEPHWRVLFSCGTVTCALNRDQAAYVAGARVDRAAIIKVTPK